VSRRISAGILLYRQGLDGIEVLLAHPGGPFFTNRDLGHWTIPKGEPDPLDDLLTTAAREFLEETGHDLREVARDPSVAPVSLGTVVQASGKVVHAWAVEGDLEPAAATSNTFEMPWPPGSTDLWTFPEIDRVAWFPLSEARRHANRSQQAFVERLAAILDVPLGPAEP
jgi:predicted NUDIX family NTP pyrophosphohydrolase